MFKKLLAAGLGLAMTVSMMTGCSLVSDGSSSSDTKTEESAAADSSEDSSEADSTADASKEESEDAGSGDLIEKKMALFMTHMSNEFTVTLSNAAKDEAAERGYALSIYDANQDAQNQADQIEQAITLGVEGIIIEPVTLFFGMKWQAFLAFLASAISKESLLGVLNTLHGTGGNLVSSTFGAKVTGSGSAVASVISDNFTKAQGLAFIYAISFNMPCVSALAATSRIHLICA